MTVNYITEPIPSAMGKGKGGWRGKIVGRSSRSLEDIAAAVAMRTGWSAYQVQSVFTGVMEETIRDTQETGRTQRLGDYGTLRLNLRGRFEGIDDVYDPARHELAFSFTPGKRLRTCKPAFVINEKRVSTLWGDGERPANAADQHAALFPSVKKRIELVARSILEEMEKPEPEPEKKPEPEEPPEDPSESDQQSEQELMKFSIVVERAGDQVTVKLEQGKSTVAEKSAKARMSDYQGAMKYVSDKLGADILKLK